MIGLLSAIGRVVIVVAAALTIISGIIAGYLSARTQEFASFGNFSISGNGQITPLEILYSLLGAAIGFVVAGAVFGAIATLYEIRDNLWLVASQSRSNLLLEELADQRVAPRIRREPHIE